ncbi:hypothetical protein RHGRI_013017 [Rhododendron griersonianum]|uniref:Uncharacterized protein n=1 Tax=Rhododendron griersonianum TaxID=479676 RepID=A0AAV6INI7_9ERIC|nr:hypothetical protein RHGRI_030278 [Rhododendron griersonianum]KAG5547200.1 hypothetical protein RHGRI_013017 [Rhododendron griersonianum]
MEVLNFFLRRSDEFLFQALVFYQFPCLDASFYYSILSPLKSVVSGKFFKRIKFLSLTGINASTSIARERQKQQEEEISMASISESLQLHVCGYIYTPSKVKIEAYCQITLLK